jgi:hypothetical protein
MSPVLEVKWIEKKLASLPNKKEKADCGNGTAVDGVLPRASRRRAAVFLQWRWAEEEAHLIVIWFCPRLTLEQAKGLDIETVGVGVGAQA